MADRLIKADSKAKFNDTVQNSAGKLVLVDFYATWCGPCRMIAPKLEEMLKEFSNLIVVKVDVDEQNELAEEYKVSAMPTFHFYKDGNKVDELVGASEGKIRELVSKHLP